jgi:hypothetical protein
MSGAKSLLCLYVFMAWTRIFNFNFSAVVRTLPVRAIAVKNTVSKPRFSGHFIKITT